MGEKLNIKNLITKLERKELSPAEALYRTLQTELWDDEKQLWREEKGSRASFDSSDNLLGVFVESYFDKHTASQQLLHLHESQLYDKEKGLWDWNDFNRMKYSYHQLFEVLALTQLDQVQAKARLEQLKKAKLYDAQWGLWRDFISDEGLRNHYNLEEQLLSVLIAEQFGKEQGIKEYKRVEAMGYHNKKGTWCSYITREESLAGGWQYVFGGTGLIGKMYIALTQNMIDRETARKNYEQIRSDVSGSERENSKAHVRLMQIWCEKVFEEHRLESEYETMPKQRKF